MRIETVFEKDTELDGLIYQVLTTEYSHVHVIEYNQKLQHVKLILSKASEALKPRIKNNHMGEGGTFSDIVSTQPDLLFAVNGTYNHYRKDFYPWHHNNYLIGDPVGLVKIRDNYYNDNPHPHHNGYLQRRLDKTWEIADTPLMENKYILSSRPLLIHNFETIQLPLEEMNPAPINTITAPSFINHGLQQHARTAVGVKGDNLVFIIAESEETEISKGLTLPELQKVGEHLKLESLLNLDGGGSSRFHLRQESTTKSFYNKTSAEDENRVLGNTLMLFSTHLL
jgi:hypothetical protein